MRALIVEEGVSRGAVAAVRGLRAGGWRVGLASPRRGPAAASRRVAWHHIPAPSDASFAEHLSGVVGSRYDVVFGAGDAEVLAVADLDGQAARAVAHPPRPVLGSLLDKRSLRGAALAAELAVPAQGPPRAGEADLPCIVKPAVHAARPVPGRIEAVVVRAEEELSAAAERIRRDGGVAVAEQLIEGALEATVVLLDRDGRVIAALEQRALSVWPREAGVSVRAETTAVDEERLERVVAMLTGVGAWGLAEVQFIRDASGRSYLIDVNPRFYGSLALALRARLNLPHLWGMVALGLPVEHGLRGRTGVRYQWLEGDVRLALARRAGVRGFADVARYSFGAAHSLLSVRDPLPALSHAFTLGRRAWSKIR